MAAQDPLAPAAPDSDAPKPKPRTGGADPSPPSVLNRKSVGRLKGAIAALALLIVAPLLLVNLGHYALWDDESLTALTAEGILQTGDTSARLGQNIVAYRSGLLIRNLHDRSSPPLQFYVAAASFSIFGATAFAARLPFALMGIGCVGLLFWWLRRADREDEDRQTSPFAWAMLGLAVIGNASLMLYFRQARYYGLATFFAVAVAYSYFHMRSRRGLIVHVALSILLLASNYMTFAAAIAALVVDYAIWGRRRYRLALADWLILVLPQVIVAIAIVAIWNPRNIGAGDPASPAGWLADRATLLGWTLRDLDRCEYGCAALIALALVVAIARRFRGELARALVALAVLIVALDIISPQSPGITGVADVRYFAPILPLLIAIEVMAVASLVASRPTWAKWVAGAIAAVGLVSNLGNVTAWRGEGRPRATIALFAHELIAPPPEPYTAVADWIRANVRSDESIWSLPDYTPYPLMFHAPRPLYAWQLDADKRSDPQFASLPSIHFRGSAAALPDYVIAFGPVVQQFMSGFQPPPGVQYRNVDAIDVFWKDAYRPELFWRSFEPIKADRLHGQSIYIFKKFAVQPQQQPLPQRAAPAAGPSSDFRL